MTIAELLNEIDALRSTECPFSKGKITFKDWIRLTDKGWVTVFIIDEKTRHIEFFDKQGCRIKKAIIRHLIKKEIVHRLRGNITNYSISYRAYREYVAYKVPTIISITIH